MQQPQAKLKFRMGSRLPMILQEEQSECGHACVAMIAYFWGHNLDLNGLRRINRPSVRGVNLRQLDAIFIELGFQTRAIRVSLSEISLIKTPAILHWNMNHFVVLKKVTKRHIIIHDPAVGIRLCNKQEFGLAFTGIVLEVEKSEHFQVIRKESKLSLMGLLKTVNGASRLLTWLLLLSLAIESMRALNPLLLQYVTDNVLGSHYLNQMYVVGLGFTLFILLQGVTEYARSHLILYLTTHIAEIFSRHIFNHLLALPLSFFESRHIGDIQSKFQSIEYIKTKLSSDFIAVLLDGLMIMLTASIMLMYSWILSLWVLAALAIYIIMRLQSFRRYKEHYVSALCMHTKSTSSFLETLQSMLPIKSYSKENVRFHLWHNDYISALNHDIQASRLQIRYQIYNQVLFQLEHILVICVGAGLIFSKQLTIGMLLAFLAYRLLLVNKASSFIQHFLDYRLLTVQLHRLNDVIQQEPDVLKEGIGQSNADSGSIYLKNISFRYHLQDPLILKDIHFEIQAGEKIAIVGPSGCGKSTLLKVMMGLERPMEGHILIDGMSLDVYGLKNFREISASVMQDDILFSGSILDNITFFAEIVDKEQVYKVARLAFIHEVIIAMPMGYDTLIEHRGATLSGGQKQRLLLARALYKEPTFLFLDEASSHLDSLSERYINQALQSLHITQIIVAHRQETIDMADRVIDLSRKPSS